MLPVILTLAACGPDADLLAEKARLEVQVADQNRVMERLEREATAARKRIEGLERQLVRARMGLDDDDALRATLRTSMGDIQCELWPDVAPNTVLNFVELAEGAREWTHPTTGQRTTSPLYTNSIFHRVIPGFMIQAGDPLGNGTGGPGYEFADEVGGGRTFDHPGLLAMANRGPDTNGSQFFITDSMPDHLNGKHTIFGDCQESLPVVRAISQVPRDAADKPLRFVVLRQVRIDRVKR